MTPGERSGGDLIIPIDKRKGRAPGVAGIHRVLGRTPGRGTAGLPAGPNVTGRGSGAVLSWVGKTAWTSRQRRGGRRAVRGPPGRSGRGRPVAQRRRPMSCCTAARSVT
ncbi:hypothetical protein GCM10010398_15640 [Streptomyces fimbriatus]